ncbi:unnamed protein product [Closterium sp. NIES-54]
MLNYSSCFACSTNAESHTPPFSFSFRAAYQVVFRRRRLHIGDFVRRADSVAQVAMRLVKPSWVSHGGQAIFAIHVHPDGTRFATGGGDHKAVIWSLHPLLSPESESDAALPSLLAPPSLLVPLCSSPLSPNRPSSGASIRCSLLNQSPMPHFPPASPLSATILGLSALSGRL